MSAHARTRTLHTHTHTDAFQLVFVWNIMSTSVGPHKHFSIIRTFPFLFIQNTCVCVCECDFWKLRYLNVNKWGRRMKWYSSCTFDIFTAAQQFSVVCGCTKVKVIQFIFFWKISIWIYVRLYVCVCVCVSYNSSSNIHHCAALLWVSTPLCTLQWHSCPAAHSRFLHTYYVAFIEASLCIFNCSSKIPGCIPGIVSPYFDMFMLTIPSPPYQSLLWYGTSGLLLQKFGLFEFVA